MFAVVYAWRVKPGKETQFQEAWHKGTLAITRRYGSHGSRLHRNHDGSFVAYAMWPDRATWQRAFDARFEHDEAEAHRQFRGAIDEKATDRAIALRMDLLDDLIVLPKS